MDQVFAPWRIDWVKREDRNAEFDDCVLCELPAAGADREHRVVARTDRAYVLLNNYPYSPGHAMVVPHDHTGDLRDLDEATTLATAHLRNRTLDALEAALGPDGFNVGLNLGGGAAGGSIDDHVHTHIVPRWAGDTNFMPVLSDTQVIVEALADTYDRLHEAFADLEGAVVEGEDAAVRFEP
jgi:ATP adenylyltransferase